MEAKPFIFIRKILILLPLLLVIQFARAQKTDQVTLQNGNNLTGEIKKLEYGKLSFNTDDFGLVSINWKKIVAIKSDKVFEIETTQGYLYIGNLGETTDTGTVIIRAGAAGAETRLIDITSIYPIKNRFFERIAGPISIGAGYTKANKLLQITYDGDLSYRGTKIYSTVSLSGAFTRQYDSIFTQRQQYTLSAGKNLRKKWFVGGLIGYEQNSELGIQSRGNLGVQLGRTFIQSNSNNLSSWFAVQGTREYYYSEDPTTNNIELVFDIKFKHFLYYTPKSDITTEVQFLPNMTDWGRIRAYYSLVFKQELFKDFFWNMNFYIQYDNKPVEQGVENLDWGITTGLGYTF